MSKPRVLTRCVANTHACRDERIVEVASDGGGCLIAFRVLDGTLYIDIYRQDPTVVVRVGGEQSDRVYHVPGLEHGKSKPRSMRDESE